MKVKVSIPGYPPVINIPVSFEKIDGKPFVFVRGPNGCGKTTLLKVLVGLLDGGDGRASIVANGVGGIEEVYHPDEDRELVRYVPQASEEALFERLSVADNYRLLCDLLQPSPKVFQEVYQRMGLSSDTPASKLSVGQKKLLVLEAVLCSLPSEEALWKPVVVLLDEPFAGLDEAKCREAVQRVASKAEEHETGRVVFVLVDHGSVVPVDVGPAVLFEVRDGVTFQFVPAKSLRVAGDDG